ncbi:MAG: hypothetical protein DMG25_16135 [Acidobacteria bacterium]|nr:MAG: hypothetical protein DMG25_16135 [Acidobacteriota bacterium]
MEEQTQGQLSIPPAPPNRGLVIAVIVLACAAAVGLFYAFRERSDAQRLAASQEQASSALSQTRSQVDALNSQLNDISARLAAQQQQKAAEAAAASEARSARAARGKRTAQVRREDPRWKKVQAQLDEEKKQLASTQQDLEKTRSDLQSSLSSTRDELGGSIAKTHDELVELEKRGERNYYEFDLTKSKGFKRVGSMSLSLRKTSTKHGNYTLAMLVDDVQLTKKSVNLYEPVVFYPPGSTQALQLVVNQIGKDEVHGYVSEPKFKRSELAASKGAPNADASSSSTSQADASLPHRSEPQH